MRAKLKHLLESSHNFDLLIQGLVLASLVSFSLETLPNLSEEERQILNWIEVSIVFVFTVEYLARCWVAEKIRNHALSFFGVVDLISILPFYLSLGVDLRALRAVRLVKIFRVLKLLRFGSAMERFGKATRLAAPELIIFSFATLIIMYLAAVGIYYFENPVQPENFPSVIHSLWWATTTLTTVGYGDIYPITAGGKIFTFFILMVGLGIVGVPTAIIASTLSAVRRDEEKQ